MRIALFSDVHSNMEALAACLEHARQHVVDQQVFIGDLIGYGGSPREVLDSIMTLASLGAGVVLGNHDEMAFAPPPTLLQEGSSGAAWTRAQLDETHLAFLKSLPLQLKINDCLFVHASAHNPHAWSYVDSELKAEQCLAASINTHQANRVFVGHVHHQSLYYRGADQKMMQFIPTPGTAIPLAKHRPFVATIGSVGQPRDGDTRAMYAILDQDRNSLTFHRVAYNFSAAAQQVRAAGLPEKLADRLEMGK